MLVVAYQQGEYFESVDDLITYNLPVVDHVFR
jgi:hypothetical protein